MALKGQYQFRGLQVADAFLRIERMWGSPQEGWTMLVSVWPTRAQAVAGLPPIEQFNRSIPFAALPFANGYAALKAEFVELADEQD